ncbi:MAG: MFS transporter, partial [Rubrobacteraceae bacterium]
LVQGTLTGTVPAATALVASTAPKERAGFRLGALQMVIFIAAGLGPALGGTFAEISGIRHSFFLTSILLAASGVMVLFGVKEVKPVREVSGEEESKERGKVGLPYKLLVPGLLALFVVHIAITSVGVALPGFLASLEAAGKHIAGQAGWILGTGALAAAAGSVLGGRVAGKIGARRAIVFSLALAGLTAIPQAFVSNVPELWMLRLVTSFFLGAVVPVANLAIRDAVPQERRGAAFGVASSAVAVGFAVGPIGGGLVSAALGFWSAFLIPGVLLAALAGILALVWGAPRLRPGRRFGTILRATVGHLMK